MTIRRRRTWTVAVACPRGVANRWLLVAAAIVLLASFWLHLVRPAAAQAQQRPTLDRILEDPTAYHGRQVTVAGEVDLVLSPRAFSIEDDDLLFDDDIMVVSRDPLPPVAGRWGEAEILEDDIVLVTGTVRPFDLVALEQELGVDLDDDLFAYWVGKSVIAATAVTLTPRTPGPTAVGIDNVTDDPSAFYGRRVAVEGEVEDVLGARAFVLEHGGATILVMTSKPTSVLAPTLAGEPLAVDDEVRIRGPVRRFDLAQVERDIDVDLDDERFAAWEDRPMVIARSLQFVPSR
jgi:hypothetical protein